MFTSEETRSILTVKSKIESHINEMRLTPWASEFSSWDDVFLSGGAIASLLQNEEPKDWDFYITTAKSLSEMQKVLMRNMHHMQEVAENYIGVIGLNGKMITANSITMNDKSSFITMAVGSPEKIKEHFDYVHCTTHYSLKDKLLYISRAQYNAIVNKKLVVNNPSSVKTHRAEKFKERGYT